eukprot:TRINITY_DN10529_c0_g1_i2.p1 TRINITY_DN10529_c0_g1~~TRINITY_DN10529_c0_g1_i2.p1  ORF type:complete len:900 (-),score=259.71 TRINITY_DN10529_c0_g1_i2:118-2817(-)
MVGWTQAQGQKRARSWSSSECGSEVTEGCDGDVFSEDGGMSDDAYASDGDFAAEVEEALVASEEAPRLGRSPSQPDLLLSEADVAGQFREWRDGLQELTGRPEEVLEELLAANVREYGWDTGEHLSQILIGSMEGAPDAAAACDRAFARARLSASADASEPSEPVPPPPSAVCVVCCEGEEIGELLQVSALCRHRLHRECLAAGLRVQLSSGATALRCPACPERLAAPVPQRVVAAAIGSDPDAEEAAERRRWTSVGEGCLFRTCPGGACRVRPRRANASLQAVCGCSARHRFCVGCGHAPHEPVPCGQMMELRGFLDSTCAELRRFEDAAAAGDVHEPSERERAALVRDLAASQRRATADAGFEEALSSKALPALDSQALRDEYEFLLGSREEGALPSSAVVALAVLRSWDMRPQENEQQLTADARRDAAGDGAEKPAAAFREPARQVEVEPADAPASSDSVVEATTRPCPRCFVPIEKDGGCQHMTCTNAACRHEFCWLCLRDWHHPGHDGLQCALKRLRWATGAAADHERDEDEAEVLAAVEKRLQENYAAVASAEGARPTSLEAYAAEVRGRFRTGLRANMQSDRELLVLGGFPGAEEAQALHLSLPLMQYYAAEEQKARTAAAVAFGPESEEQPRAREAVRRFVAWMRVRWWLRLLPEDAADPSDLPVPEGDWGEQQRTRFVVQLRTQHAVHCMRRREADRARGKLLDSACERFLQRFARRELTAEDRFEAARRLRALVLDNNTPAAHAAVVSPAMVADAAAATARGAALARAAKQAWQAGRLLELVGVLQPREGFEARQAALAAGRWAEEVEVRAARLQELLRAATLRASEAEAEAAEEEKAPVADAGLDDCERAEELRGCAASLDDARRSLFSLSLEYCGGSRHAVKSRAER